MEESAKVSWVRLPLYRSLTDFLLFAGVPKTFLIINVGVGIFFALYFHFWYIIAVNVLMHFACQYFSSSDPQFFDCFSLYSYKHDYYST